MSGSIVGKIINQQDGLPIPGAQLRLSGEGVTQDTTSSHSGEFQFDDLAPGKYDLHAAKEGFEAADFGPLAVVEDVSTEITIALQPAAGP